ncbi:MAG: hypothetical protein QNJ78_14810 [Gammaproteobacteria bacterium]|nr:hypothetical protein [Gammaproteobacteria bacterium]
MPRSLELVKNATTDEITEKNLTLVQPTSGNSIGYLTVATSSRYRYASDNLGNIENGAHPGSHTEQVLDLIRLPQGIKRLS